MRRFAGFCLLVLFVFGVLFSSVSAEPPAPKITVSSNKLAQYRFLSVSVKIHLRYKTTTRTRSKTFMAYTGRKKVKRMDVQNGATWLNLSIETIPPNQIKLLGALKLGDELQPIRIDSGPILPKQQFHFSTSARLKKMAEARIHVSAFLSNKASHNANSSFVLRFEGVTLSRLLHKVAEFNGLRLSLDKSIPEKHGLTVKIDAPSRKDVIQVVCRKFQVQCEVMGQVLWVRPKS